ncbi:MAG: DUF1697 domain-containing protein [Pyrinomonadaceae bacterium]
MPKLFAFLRAINVGGHVVKMDQLRELFVALNLTNVETFIASGNVIFESRSKNPTALERKIENYLAKSVGYEVATFVRTLEELERINEYRPFSEAELNAQGNTLYVGFIADIPAKAAAQKVEALATDVDYLKVNGREVYWLCCTSFSDTKISGALLEKTLGMKITLRNINTIRRLVKKYS